MARAPEFVRRQLLAGDQAVTVLGRFPTALYLQLDGGQVIALLNADAVALPIGIVVELPTPSLDLSRLGSGGARISSGTLVLESATGPTEGTSRHADGRAGTVVVEPTGHRDTALRRCREPDAELLARARTQLATLAERNELAGQAVPEQVVAGVELEPELCVDRLLGCGPGLTPAGDDALCGMLAAGSLYGPSPRADQLSTAVRNRLAQRPAVTTSLSRALLIAALDGQGIEQLTRLARAVRAAPSGAVHRVPGPDQFAAVDDAVVAISRIGHTSGIALGLGLLAEAATRSIQQRSAA